MKPTNLEDEDELGFFQRYKVILIVGVLALAGGGWFFMNQKPSKSTSKKKMDMVMVMPVMPPPPPPPPPPPKPPEPEPEEKKEDEEAPPEEAPPEEAPMDKPADKPADEPIGTAIAGGDGTGGLGVGGGTGGGGGGGGIGGKSYSERGRWQGQFARDLEAALRSEPKLRTAKGRFPVRVWIDDAGRATRVVLNGTTGDAAKDAALESTVRSRVFNAPVPGTPMPVKIMFNAR